MCTLSVLWFSTVFLTRKVQGTNFHFVSAVSLIGVVWELCPLREEVNFERTKYFRKKLTLNLYLHSSALWLCLSRSLWYEWKLNRLCLLGRRWDFRAMDNIWKKWSSTFVQILILSMAAAQILVLSNYESFSDRIHLLKILRFPFHTLSSNVVNSE